MRKACQKCALEIHKMLAIQQTCASAGNSNNFVEIFIEIEFSMSKKINQFSPMPVQV